MKGDDLWVVEIMAEGGENANRKGCFGRFSSLSCLVLQTATASAALNDAATRCFIVLRLVLVEEYGQKTHGRISGILA